MTATNKRYDIKFFRFLIKKVKREIHGADLCRVTEIDGDTCTVQPLDKKTGGDKRALILSVRIGLSIKDYIEVGSQVAVSYFDRDVSEADVGTTGDIDNASGRLHSLNDAYISEVFNGKSTRL